METLQVSKQFEICEMSKHSIQSSGRPTKRLTVREKPPAFAQKGGYCQVQSGLGSIGYRVTQREQKAVVLILHSTSSAQILRNWEPRLIKLSSIISSSLGTMRQGIFEVSLYNDDRQQLEERAIGQDTMVAGISGETFYVAVTLHRSPGSEYCSSFLRVLITVDGICTSSTIFSPSITPQSLKERGFRKDQYEVLQFKFSEPTITGPSVNHPPQHLGVVQVRFCIALVDNTPINGVFGHYGLPGQGAIPESKKILDEASLYASAGDPLYQPRRLFPYKIADYTHICTMKLKYHTPETITFLQDYHRKKAERDARATRLAAAWKNGEVVDLTGQKSVVDLATEEVKGDGNAGACNGGERGVKREEPLLDLTEDAVAGESSNDAKRRRIEMTGVTPGGSAGRKDKEDD